MLIDPNRMACKELKTAVFCLDENGFRLAEHLARLQECDALYIPARFAEGNEGLLPLAENSLPERIYFEDWKAAFGEAFHHYSALICIMAAGIVVRSLAPLLASKLTDPAVIVIDEKGSYIISLLSGHIGGANQLAREIAGKLGGQAVITTATDVNGTSAVDLMAVEMDAVIDPIARIKTINRYLAENKAVHLYSPWPFLQIPKGFTWQGWPWEKGYGTDRTSLYSPIAEDQQLLEPAVLVSPWKEAFDARCEVIQLRPRNLVVGVGCRKHIQTEVLEKALKTILQEYSLDENCICKFASIDFKLQENALQELAAIFKIPLLGFTAEEIRTLDGSYQSSHWVYQQIGVGGVCEPAAQLASGKGLMLVPKQKAGAVTISVAMEKSWWWDWGQAAETC